MTYARLTSYALLAVMLAACSGASTGAKGEDAHDGATANPHDHRSDDDRTGARARTDATDDTAPGAAGVTEATGEDVEVPPAP